MDEFEEIWPDDYILYLRLHRWSEDAIIWRIQQMEWKRKLNGLGVTPDGRMTTRAAARYLGFQRPLLAQWRHRKQGPLWYQIGSRYFYYQEDLDRWLEEQKND